MRTNRLSRWLAGGALVAAGVAAAFGGQSAANGDGGQTDSVVSNEVDTVSPDQGTTQTTSSDDVASTNTYEWG